MRNALAFLRFSFFWFWAVPILGASQSIQLQPGAWLLCSGTNLDVGDYAIPCVADWNGDGRKDLIVGYRYADKVAVFYNEGSDAIPVFNTSSNLQAGGIDIQHIGAGCGAPAPFVCDFDNDGKRDLLVGTGAEGYVFFYRNIGTDAKPSLAPGVQLKVGTNALAVAARATPFVYDWDGDGLRDLLCGDGNGTVSFFRNIGSAQSPTFAPAVLLQAGGATLNLGIRSVVRVCDWDGDGLPDLIGSSTSGVYWCRNEGSASAPVLGAPVAISAPVSTGGQIPINTGARMRLDVVDWNDDGVPDILVGNYDGRIAYFEGYRFAFTRMSVVSNQAVLAWNSAPFLRYNLLAGLYPSSITNIAFSNLASAGRVTTRTNLTTLPPSYYRLQIVP